MNSDAYSSPRNGLHGALESSHHIGHDVCRCSNLVNGSSSIRPADGFEAAGLDFFEPHQMLLCQAEYLLGRARYDIDPSKGNSWHLGRRGTLTPPSPVHSVSHQVGGDTVAESFFWVDIVKCVASRFQIFGSSLCEGVLECRRLVNHPMTKLMSHEPCYAFGRLSEVYEEMTLFPSRECAKGVGFGVAPKHLVGFGSGVKVHIRFRALEEPLECFHLCLAWNPGCCIWMNMEFEHISMITWNDDHDVDVAP